MEKKTWIEMIRDFILSIIAPSVIHELRFLRQSIKQKSDEVAELKRKLEEDTKYYDAQIKQLNQELLDKTSGFVKFPDSVKTSSSVINNPNGFFAGTSIRTSRPADPDYYAPSKREWEKLLSRIHSKMEANYKVSVMDCDNFAMRMVAMTMYSAYKSGLDKQLAIGIFWSQNHAFCGALTAEGNVELYEPQSGTWVGTWDRFKKLTRPNGLIYMPLTEVFWLT